jgi:hypothetical protein
MVVQPSPIWISWNFERQLGFHGDVNGDVNGIVTNLKEF